MQFAERYFTKGQSDPQHQTKFKSCLVRIPETYNLKCLNKGLNQEESKIKIIQKWNGKRLPIQLLLKDFRRWLIQEEINHKREIKIQEIKYKQSPSNLLNIKAIEWI